MALLFPLLYNPIPPVKGGGGGEIPEVEFVGGEFWLYTPQLSKKGRFQLVELYRNRYFVGRGVKVEELLQRNWGWAEEVNGTSREVELHRFALWNSHYRLESRKGVYLPKARLLRGGEFNFTSPEGVGTGKGFRVSADRKVEGEGVEFKIKVE
ncbi:MAG: hypothetical protein ABGW77_05345 [Campylobacterales bacterium]